MANNTAQPTQEYTLEVDSELRFEIEKPDTKVSVEVGQKLSNRMEIYKIL